MIPKELLNPPQPTMAAQPSQVLVDQICSIVNLSPMKATILLQKNNNDLEKAMDAYFGDPDGSVKPEASNREWEYQDNIPCE